MVFLTSLLSSVFAGGATGILGIVVQRYFDDRNKEKDIKSLELKYAHEINLRKVDAEIMREEWAARTKVAEMESAAKIDVAESEAFSETLFHEPERYSADVKPSHGQGWVFVLLDLIRGLVRPALTLYLCVLTTLIYFRSQAMMDPALSGVQYFKVLEEIVGTVLYLTITCVTWWFGTRNKGKGVTK